MKLGPAEVSRRQRCRCLFIELKLTRLGMPYYNTVSDRLVHRRHICLKLAIHFHRAYPVGVRLAYLSDTFGRAFWQHNR